MKSLVFSLIAFLLGCSITLIIDQMMMESFYNEIRIQNESYLSEKQSYRLENSRLKSELDNCKRNYESVAELYFDSPDEYEVK